MSFVLISLGFAYRCAAKLCFAVSLTQTPCGYAAALQLMSLWSTINGSFSKAFLFHCRALEN